MTLEKDEDMIGYDIIICYLFFIDGLFPIIGPSPKVCVCVFFLLKKLLQKGGVSYIAKATKHLKFQVGCLCVFHHVDG